MRDKIKAVQKDQRVYRVSKLAKNTITGNQLQYDFERLNFDLPCNKFTDSN